MKIKTQADIPADWKVLTARRKTLVTIRQSNGVEKFKVSWQDAELTSDPKLDLIVIQESGSEYPHKLDIFMDVYSPVGVEDYSSGSIFQGWRWVKKAVTQIVIIPEGETVEIETLEGTLPAVTFPDYIAIGIKGEVYANSKEFADNNLEFI